LIDEAGYFALGGELRQEHAPVFLELSYGQPQVGQVVAGVLATADLDVEQADAVLEVGDPVLSRAVHVEVPESASHQRQDDGDDGDVTLPEVAEVERTELHGCASATAPTVSEYS